MKSSSYKKASETNTGDKSFEGGIGVVFLDRKSWGRICFTLSFYKEKQSIFFFSTNDKAYTT